VPPPAEPDPEPAPEPQPEHRTPHLLRRCPRSTTRRWLICPTPRTCSRPTTTAPPRVRRATASADRRTRGERLSSLRAATPPRAPQTTRTGPPGMRPSRLRRQHIHPTSWCRRDS
jgi:hypothetical protein